MKELYEALGGVRWWRKGTPAAVGGSRADGCFLLALFGSGATPAAEASPGTSPKDPQAWVGGHHGPLYVGRVPTASGSSC